MRLFRERDCIAGHRRRARSFRVENTLTYEEWVAIRRFFGDRCIRCGFQYEIVADHIVSMRDGGPNAIRNIQPLCHRCNILKGRGADDYRDPARLATFLAQIAPATP